jgi:hypothetical protein
MAIQTVIASGPPSQAGGSLRLHNPSTDAQVATEAASETASGSTCYTAAFADVAAGTYRVKFVDSTGRVRAKEWVTLQLATGTYTAYEMPLATSVTAAAVADAVCDELLSDHETDGSLGQVLSNLGSRVAGAPINVVSHFSGGELTVYVDDDYTVRSDTQLAITVSDPTSALFDKLDVLGVEALSFGAARDGKPAGEITGTISDMTHVDGITTFVVEITACGTGLRPGEGCWQIQSSQEHDGETDDFVEVAGTLVLQRRVVAPLG